MSAHKSAKSAYVCMKVRERRRSKYVRWAAGCTGKQRQQCKQEGAQKKHMSKAAVAIIAVVVVAIIVVAGVFGFRAYSDAQYNNAVAACAAASENVRNATNDYNNLVNGDASEAAALTKKDVKDASTLDALNKELSVELPVYEGCVADDTAGFKSATAKLNEQADWYKAYTRSLQKAVDAVNASKK